MKHQGMKTYFKIWVGYFAFRIGKALTRFGLLIWIYKQTNSANTVAVLGFFSFLPLFLIIPIAGVIVDRLDRRIVMLLAYAGAGLTVLGLLWLYATGNLQIWHLYLAEGLTGSFEAFQNTAFTATTGQLLPHTQYARASGLRSVSESAAEISAPFLAGFLITAVGISGVMAINILAVLIAVTTLIIVKVPKLALESTSGNISKKGAGKVRFAQEVSVGFRYIWQQSGLRGLTLLYMGFNFLDGMSWVSILPVMILARSGGNEIALASVQSSLGLAGVVGGILISIGGGSKRNIHPTLLGPALSFLLGGTMIALGRNVVWWSAAAWLSMIFVPFLSSSNQAIWLSKVKPDMQGRVLSTYSTIRQSMLPIGILLGGMLAESWFEPAMMPGGALTRVFGQLVGTGPGAGMAVMFLGSAVLGGVLGLAGYLSPAVRHVEDKPKENEHNLPGGVMPVSA